MFYSPARAATGSHGAAYLAPCHANTHVRAEPCLHTSERVAADTATAGGGRCGNPGLFCHLNMTLGVEAGPLLRARGQRPRQSQSRCHHTSSDQKWSSPARSYRSSTQGIPLARHALLFGSYRKDRLNLAQMTGFCVCSEDTSWRQRRGLRVLWVGGAWVICNANPGLGQEELAAWGSPGADAEANTRGYRGQRTSGNRGLGWSRGGAAFLLLEKAP